MACERCWTKASKVSLLHNTVLADEYTKLLPQCVNNFEVGKCYKLKKGLLHIHILCHTVSLIYGEDTVIAETSLAEIQPIVVNNFTSWGEITNKEFEDSLKS